MSLLQGLSIADLFNELIDSEPTSMANNRQIVSLLQRQLIADLSNEPVDSEPASMPTFLPTSLPIYTSVPAPQQPWYSNDSQRTGRTYIPTSLLPICTSVPAPQQPWYSNDSQRTGRTYIPFVNNLYKPRSKPYNLKQ